MKFFKKKKFDFVFEKILEKAKLRKGDKILITPFFMNATEKHENIT